MKHLARFVSELPIREGADAIYIEPPIIAYVHVSDIHANDHGIAATINVGPTPGMNGDCVPSFRISSSWETFSSGKGHWHAIYVNWSVYFGSEQVKIGLKIGSQAAAQGFRVQLRQIRTALEEEHRR